MIYQLNELTTIKRGGSPRPITDYISDTGYPWLKISDFEYGQRVVNNVHEYIIKEGLSKTKLVPKGSLIVTNSASPGIPIFLGKDMCLHDGFLYFEKISNKVNSLYLYYFMMQQRDYLKSQGNGSIFVNLKKEILERVKINLPNLEIQNHIVNTIGSVDDFIEKNNIIKSKIDALLELEWNNCINHFETYEYKLKDLISFSNTGADAIQKAPIVEYETNCRCARVGDFTNNRNYNDWAYCNINSNIFSQYQLKKDDILITRTASIGLTKFIYKDINAVYNNGIIRIRANNKIQPVILYLICCSKDFANHIKGIEGASSTRPNMKINHLLDYDVKIPNINVQNQICNKLKKMMSQKENIINKTNKLVDIKSILLNKYFN